MLGSSTMGNLYQFVSGFEIWWLVAFGLIFLAVEWIVIDIGIFLTLSITSFAVAATMAFVSNPVIVTWSIPVWLAISFVVLRPMLKISSGQKDVYSDKNYIGKIGRVKAVGEDNLSSQHFYDYKQSMPLESRNQVTAKTTFRLVMKDGKELNIAGDTSLEDGASAVVKTQDHDIVTVEPKNG